MVVHFHVLASGSSGNCSLLDVDGFGILIDVGLGPRQLVARHGTLPPLWERVHAVLLTHVHGDHWNENSLNHLVRRGVPLYCHPEHARDLEPASPAFASLVEAGLVRSYAIGEPLSLGAGCRCEPLALRHDGGITCGFRMELGCGTTLAYAADLGSWDRRLARSLADVELLALEFNHDVAMQYASGRSLHLIRRVLGDHGHLSNTQAAALVAAVLQQSRPGRLQHLVQLHLSRECNRPELAQQAAQAVVRHRSVTVHSTSQDDAGPCIALGAGRTIAPPYIAASLFADWDFAENG
jgi:phosphoribosyl 1,2-cyclic phosphodiesterase